jgi:thiaminase
MSKIYWKRATTRKELDDAQRVRFRCLVEETGIAQPGSGAGLRRDISALDALPNIEHVLLYRDDEAIGTARIAFPESEIARATQTSFGFEIERFLDLATLPIADGEIAEVSRLCVLRAHATSAAPLLYEALYVQARLLRRVRFLVGGVDTRTADYATALRLFSLLEREGLVSERFRVETRATVRAAVGAGSPARLAGSAGEHHGTDNPSRLGGLVHTFARRLGARVVGAPVPHAHFPRYVIPMLADLTTLPAATLRHFEPGLKCVPVAVSALYTELIDVARASLRDLDCHPIGSELISGVISREGYAGYLIQVVHYVRHSGPMLELASQRSAALGRHRLAAMFDAKAREERGHDHWALQDLAALGIPEDAVARAPCSTAARAYVAWLNHIAESVPAALLGLAFLLEFLGSARAGRAAANLVRHGAIPKIESGVRFLAEHGSADEDHVQAFSGPLAEIEDEDEADAILLSARVTARLYLGLLEWGAADSCPRTCPHAA